MHFVIMCLHFPCGLLQSSCKPFFFFLLTFQLPEVTQGGADSSLKVALSGTLSTTERNTLVLEYMQSFVA